MATFTTIALLTVGAQQAYKANQASKKAARAGREANRVATNEGKIKDINARRAAARKMRVRRAQMQQGAVNTGLAGSSTSLGAQGALATNNSASSAASRGSQLSNQSIANFNNMASQFQASANEHSAISGAAFQFAALSNAERKPGGAE